MWSTIVAIPFLVLSMAFITPIVQERCRYMVPSLCTQLVTDLAPILFFKLLALFGIGFDLCPGMVKLGFAITVPTNDR